MRAPRHVVHVITRLLQGGAEENTVLTCLDQAARGDRVTLVHGPDSHPSWSVRLAGKMELVAVATLDQPIRPARDWRAVRDLAALFARLGPDVVHTHQSKAGILGRLAAARAGVPLIVHTIHIAPFVNVGGLRRLVFIAAERVCARSTSLFISVSEGMRQAFVEQGIGTGKPFAVVHSGMPLERFAEARAPADWRKRVGGWERAARPRFVLMLAAFEPRKRQRPLLAALAPGLRARPDTCVLLAGAGSELERCRELARALGIDGQVRFAGHDPNPQELIALADLCVLTSEREGLPRVAVQYVAAGKPVVLSRLPGIEELIVDGVNGVITDPDELGDSAARILALLDDDAALARLAAGARATDVSRWGEQAMGAAIEAAYARAEDERRATRSPAGVGVVELFGLPGAGKTAVTRAFIALLAARGRAHQFSGEIMGDALSRPRRSLRRLAMIARTLPFQPRIALRLLAGLRTARGGWRDVAKSLWNRTSVEAMLLDRRHGAGMLVLDQGRIQAEWSQAMHGWRPAGDDAGGKDGRDQCLFVWVDAPPEVARRRLAARGAVTARLQRPGAGGEAWTRGDGLVRDLAARLEARPSHVLRLANGDGADPAALAAQIVARIERIEARARGVA